MPHRLTREAAERAATILLVDDDPVFLEVLAALLTSLGEGHRTLAARDIDGALERIRTGAPDVVLLDLNLQGKDGLDLLGFLSYDAAPPPVVVLTASADERVERRALAAGATDFLVKDQLDGATLARALRYAIQRSRAALAVRERDALFRSVYESAHDALLVYDDEGRAVDANAAGLRFLGIGRPEVFRRPVVELLSWTPPAEEWSGELALVVSGRPLVAHCSVRRGIVPGRHLLALRDITALREGDALRSRLAAIVSSAEDAVVGHDVQGRITDWNPAAERLFEVPAPSAIGRTFVELLRPEDRALVQGALERVAGGERVRNLECSLVRRDGSLVALALSASPLLAASDEVVGISTIVRDVTETQSLRARAAKADRLSALGLLAAGVAHEINNPLTAIIASLEASARDLEEGADAGTLSEVRSDLNGALEAAWRVRNIVRDLKLFSRPDETVAEPVDVEKVLDSTVRMVLHEIRPRARLVRDFRAPPRVLANDSRLAQIFLNLVVNAAQAIPEGDVEHNAITLRTREEDGAVLVEVADTGCGIPPENLRRIFEPFFTTKPVGIGTGLGLAICHGIVRSMGGELRVQSTPGQGSTFTVALPLAPAASVVHVLPAAASAPARSRARILVVDDEPMVAQMVARLLEGRHEVAAVTSAREALALVNGGARFDAVLCDLMMPEMTGMDLDAMLVAQDAAWGDRLGFFSGGIFTERGLAFVQSCTRPRLEKPFAREDLLDFVERVLDAGSRSAFRSGLAHAG